MPVARALIVDDSRTAQHRLRKLLNRYNLEVDTATSAEEALGYLSYKMPSVIFMDHHMEGMDGFEALKIIKANPSTATIPVIMYTSQSDDVYAGQAHALGALDTLSKNLMRPSRIEEVLAKLSIIPPTQEPAASNDSTPIPPPPPVDIPAHGPQISNEKPASSFNASELKAQIARLFELHIADVRTQITENTKFIVRRLASEIKNSSEQEKRVDDVPLSVLNDEARAESSKNALVSNSLLCLILIALAAISFQIFQSQQQINTLTDKYNHLADINYQESLLLDDLVVATRAERPSSSNMLKNKALLETLAWAMSIDMHFDYGEEPLGEGNILNLQNLAFRLYDAGFSGFVELNIHLGNFCLAPDKDGNLGLAPKDLPLSECQFLKDQKADLSAENYTNVTYVQFEQTTAPIQSGAIEFIINLSAFETPMYAYPELQLNGVTAGEWNSLARQNQLVVLSIESAL